MDTNCWHTSLNTETTTPTELAWSEKAQHRQSKTHAADQVLEHSVEGREKSYNQRKLTYFLYYRILQKIF